MKRIYDINALMQRTGLSSYQQLIENDYDVLGYLEEIKDKLCNDITDLELQLNDIECQIKNLNSMSNSSTQDNCTECCDEDEENYIEAVDTDYNSFDDCNYYNDCSLSDEHFSGLSLGGMYIGT